MAAGLLSQLKAMFDGDPGVRKVADDPVLSAELLLLFRMILADGVVQESEMAMFRRICRDAFGIGDESFDGVVEYLNDFGYETNGAQAIAMFRELDIERRQVWRAIWPISPRQIRNWPKTRCGCFAARWTCWASARSTWSSRPDARQTCRGPYGVHVTILRSACYQILA